MMTSNGEEDGEDRLSALPDDILHNILSLLSTKPAVASSLLSSRWRALWTHIISLEFKISLFIYKDTSYSVTIIVGILFTKAISRCILKYTVHLNLRPLFGVELPQEEGDVSCIQSWLYQLCEENNVKLIHVNPIDETFCLVEVNLPRSVFQTPSLVMLDLDSKFSFDFKAKSFSHLSNLQELIIDFRDYCHRTIISKLITSFPSLETLIFWASKQYRPKYGHSYLELSTQNQKYYFDVNLCCLFFENTKVLMNASPKFVVLTICENFPSKEYLLQVVEYMLNKSKDMEQLVIRTDQEYSAYDRAKCIKEKQLCQQLQRLLSQNYLQCKIVFSGVYFETSVQPSGRIVLLSHWQELHDLGIITAHLFN